MRFRQGNLKVFHRFEFVFRITLDAMGMGGGFPNGKRGRGAGSWKKKGNVEVRWLAAGSNQKWDEDSHISQKNLGLEKERAWNEKKGVACSLKKEGRGAGGNDDLCLRKENHSKD